MNRYLFTVVIGIFLSVSGLQAHTAAPLKIRDAIRLVVITDDEGIHYEQGCGFYELRALLAAAEDQLSTTVRRPTEPLYELHLIGKAGSDSIYVGDHWVGSDTGTALLSAGHFGRIAGLIDMRKGSGVGKHKIKTSIRRATKRIQDPTYREVNLCSEHY